MAENHSWKARVCVGLKVYSKDPELTVDVVEPGKPETEEENESTKVMVDLDDSTRDVKPVDGGADAGAGLTDPSVTGAAENGEEKKYAVNGETKEKVGEKKGDEEVLKEAALEDID